MSERGSFSSKPGKSSASSEMKGARGIGRKQSSELIHHRAGLPKKFQTPHHTSKGEDVSSALYLKKKIGSE